MRASGQANSLAITDRISLRRTVPIPFLNRLAAAASDRLVQRISPVPMQPNMLRLRPRARRLEPIATGYHTSIARRPARKPAAVTAHVRRLRDNESCASSYPVPFEIFRLRWSEMAQLMIAFGICTGCLPAEYVSLISSCPQRQSVAALISAPCFLDMIATLAFRSGNVSSDL